MIFKFPKNLLLAGICTGVMFSNTAFAEKGNAAVEAVQQQRTVRGTVSDASGPIIGATVMEKGTSNGTVTDFDGNFSINVKPGATLVISYIGYKAQEITVGNSNSINVLLEQDNQSLDEVVVVGYGVQKKKLVTGATVEVKGEAIANRNTISPLSALQNQSPGVNIVASSGQPGDGFKVNIRGAGTNGDPTPIYVIDGVAGGDINSINPADIERIDVLKDAASAAIYGARAANGVILVTTKQGKAGKVQVNYDGNMGWQNVVKLPRMLTAGEYMTIQDITSMNGGGAPYDWTKYLNQDLIDAYRNGSNPGTNWLELLKNKNAMTTSQSLNISGGSDLSRFSSGFGYQFQDGVFGGPVKSNFSRFTFRINSEHVIYRHGNRDVVKFGENIYFQHRQSQGIRIGNQYNNAIYTMMAAAPIVPVYAADGTMFDYDDLRAQGTEENGLLALNQYMANPLNKILAGPSANNKNKSFNLNAVAFLEIQPIKGLTYRGQLSYKQYANMWKTYEAVYNNNMNEQRTADQMDMNMGMGWNWSTTNTLNYVFDLKKHNFDMLVGTEYSREGNNMAEQMRATATNSLFSDFRHAYFNNFSTHTNLQGFPSDDHSLLSYFGRLNYNFDEKYMFSAIIRADGSSNFAQGHRWGWFPSFSAGWVLSNEKFMQSMSNWWNFMKLRASWGQNGNENIGAYGYYAAYSFGYDGLYSFNNDKTKGMQGGYPSRLSNPDLTWETSEQTDIGFDARFLNNRLALSFDWYNKETKDLLIEVPISPINGHASQRRNAGSVRNTGVELALNWTDLIGKDFRYNVGWNIASNSNKVTAVRNGSGYINGGQELLSEGTDYIARMEEGLPIGYFWGFKTAGVIQNQADLDDYLVKNCGGQAANSLQGTGIAPGGLKFVDVNGDGKIDSNDKTMIGNPHPKVTMGINLGASWSGFDFSLSSYAALGMQIAHTYRKFGNGQFDNWTSEVYKYWHGEGTSNRYPLLLPGNTVNLQNISDIYIDDAGYFRLQNLTLGYDFCRLWKNSPFQQLRLYFQAQNLFTITSYEGMDPEQGTAIGDESWVTGVDVGNYPQPRTFLIGVNIKF